MTRTKQHALPLLWIVVFVFAAATAWADSHVRVVRLSYVNGDVEMDRATGNGFEKAILNMPVVYRSQIRTGDDGEAELEFENGSTLRLTPDTQITVSDLSLTDNGTKVTHINLDHGLAYLEWKHKGDSSFELTANNRTLTLKKSTHLRIHSQEDALYVAVLNGEASVTATGGPQIAVKKGQTLTLDSTDPNRYSLAKSIETGSYDSWDKDRDDTRNLIAQQSSGYLPSDNYYGPDLGYYGSWFNSPYGSLWQPYNYYPGWSPYADGSWAFYPSFGWQWVSAYPWGFLPYHFGNWIFINGRGWCWRRPTHWGGWHNVSPVISANGHGAGIVPSNGGRGNGIVPAGNGIVPRPPSNPANSNSPTLVSVGRGPNVPWRNPTLRNGRELNVQAFRGDPTRASSTTTRPSSVTRTGGPAIYIGNPANHPHSAAGTPNSNLARDPVRENRVQENHRNPVPTINLPSVQNHMPGTSPAPAVTPRRIEPSPREMPAPASRPAPMPMSPRASPPPAPHASPAPAPMPHVAPAMPHASPAPVPHASPAPAPMPHAAPAMPHASPAPMPHASPAPAMPRISSPPMMHSGGGFGGGGRTSAPSGGGHSPK